MNNTKLKPYSSWLIASALYLATIISQLSNLIYQSVSQNSPVSEIIIPSLVFITLLTIPSLIIGFKLGKELDIRLLRYPEPGEGYSKNPIIFAVVAGIILGLVLLGVREISTPYLPEEIPEYGFRGVWGGLFVSIGAAIGEEIWFRFGLMTLLLWTTKRLFKLEQINTSSALVIIILTGIAFGAAHVPQLVAYGAGTSFAIWGTILGNIAVSILYGWCYWRYGLISAIISHFVLDIVLHVVPAF